MVILTAAAVIVPASAAARSDARLDDGGPAASVSNRSAAKRLATTLAGARDLPRAVAATREALALGGVATMDGPRTVVPARGLAAPLVTSTVETLNMAAEAGNRGSPNGASLAELSNVLRRAGFPIRKGSAGQKQMVRFLKAWVRQARRRPSDPGSFAPLFLSETARLRQRRVNVAKGNYLARDLRLTMLETELVAAAFHRVRGAAARHPRRARQSQSASTPCSEFKQYLEQEMPLVGRAWGVGLNFVTGKALEEVVKKGGRGKLSDAQVNKALAALNVLLRVQKLVAFYGAITIRVFTQENDTVHKPTDRQNVNSNLVQHFSGIVGIDEEKYRAYQEELARSQESLVPRRAVRDCMAAAGLPVYADAGDIAGELESYTVRWTFDLARNHARINVPASKFDFPGQQRHKLRRLSASEAGAASAIDVLTERNSDHRGRARQKSTYVIATAEVNGSQPPSTQTFVTAAQGGLGLSDPVAEMVAGLIQSLATPSASDYLKITYHVPGPEERDDCQGRIPASEECPRG